MERLQVIDICNRPARALNIFGAASTWYRKVFDRIYHSGLLQKFKSFDMHSFFKENVYKHIYTEICLIGDGLQILLQVLSWFK